MDISISISNAQGGCAVFMSVSSASSVALVLTCIVAQFGTDAVSMGSSNMPCS